MGQEFFVPAGTVLAVKLLKQVWTKSPDGGWLLQKKRDRIKRLDVNIANQLRKELFRLDRWGLVSHQKCMEWKSM
jgi:hypothetical protein